MTHAADPALADLALRFALANAVQHGGQATAGAVIGKIMALDAAYRGRAQEVAAAAAAAIQQVNGMGAEAQKEKLAVVGAPELAKEKRREGLPDLPGADAVAKVVMRFAPNPNGPASLGHTRGMCINGFYAKQHGGELLLRFDDTDPVNKAPWLPAYQMFIDAFHWLGFPPSRILMASDRLDIYYEHAERALEQGAAYTCACEQETFKVLKVKGEACPHRDEDAKVQLKRWKGMLDGSTGPGGCVVRIRTDIAHPDPALRDWVALRVVDIEAHPHCRTGAKYPVWPMLDFESAIEDHLNGTTHIIRGKDLADSEKKQRFLYEHFGWEYPRVLHWGRVGLLEFGKFSTSQMRRDIEAGNFTGWDDPRLPTLQALKRRGFLPEAILKFWLSLGLTEKDIDVSAANVEAENRKLLDLRADRLFFVAQPAAVFLDGLDEPFHAKLARHPDRREGAPRELTLRDEVLLPSAEIEKLTPGTTLRLKDAFNIKLASDERATFVSRDPKAPRDGPILQWVPPPGVPTLVMKPDGTQDVGVAEQDILRYKADDAVQFERYGFVRIEDVGRSGVRAVYTHP